LTSIHLTWHWLLINQLDLYKLSVSPTRESKPTIITEIIEFSLAIKCLTHEEEKDDDIFNGENTLLCSLIIR
jgi:hypothetical protein